MLFTSDGPVKHSYYGRIQISGFTTSYTQTPRHTTGTNPCWRVEDDGPFGLVFNGLHRILDSQPTKGGCRMRVRMKA